MKWTKKYQRYRDLYYAEKKKGNLYKYSRILSAKQFKIVTDFGYTISEIDATQSKKENYIL